jgi:hypothetical protein
MKVNRGWSPFESTCYVIYDQITFIFSESSLATVYRYLYTVSLAIDEPQSGPWR